MSEEELFDTPKSIQKPFDPIIDLDYPIAIAAVVMAVSKVLMVVEN
jgi:hypothetical protein